MRGWFVVTAGLCLAQPALAASAPPTTVMMGTVAVSSIGTGANHCGANAGPAMFQRGAASAANAKPSAIIDIPTIGGARQSDALIYSFTGVLLLKFASATDGSVHFDYDNTHLPSNQTAPFDNYSQVWTPSAGTLKVSFDILLPNCTLPITALFRTIP